MSDRPSKSWTGMIQYWWCDLGWSASSRFLSLSPLSFQEEEGEEFSGVNSISRGVYQHSFRYVHPFVGPPRRSIDWHVSLWQIGNSRERHVKCSVHHPFLLLLLLRHRSSTKCRLRSSVSVQGWAESTSSLLLPLPLPPLHGPLDIGQDTRQTGHVTPHRIPYWREECNQQQKKNVITVLQ